MQQLIIEAQWQEWYIKRFPGGLDPVALEAVRAIYYQGWVDCLNNPKEQDMAARMEAHDFMNNYLAGAILKGMGLYAGPAAMEDAELVEEQKQIDNE